MIAAFLAAPVVVGAFGKYKYDDYKRKPLKEQFELKNLNAPALYFPKSVNFFGRIQILDCKAVDPDLEDKDDDDEDEAKDATATEPGAEPAAESAASKHFKSFSKRGMKWLSKMKIEAEKKLDEAKKEYEKMQAEKEAKAAAEKEQTEQQVAEAIVDDEKKQETDPLLKFSENARVQRQSNLPDYFEPYFIDPELAKSAQDLKPLITSHADLVYKWRECEVFMIKGCMYLRVQSEWRYLSFFNKDLDFIPMSIKNDNNISYFYWKDKTNNYVIGRCPTVITIEGDDEHKDKVERVNFINAYIQCKTEIISTSTSFTDHIRKQWSMHEDMLKARKDVMDDAGNASLMWHRNEFEINLKLMITGKEDIRSNYWGKFDGTEKCEMEECETVFSTFTRPHHCYVCGKVICDNCGKNKFLNPINEMEQRACNKCFSIWYPTVNQKDSVQNLDTNEVVKQYEADKAHQFEWNDQERSILTEAGILCHWIYDGQVDEKLVELLGFRQLKLVRYGQENQQTQYAIVTSVAHPDIVYMVYRGSYDIMDWLTNFQTNPLKLMDVGFRVHSGMYCSLQQHALDVCIDELCNEHVIPHKKRLVICGHSLGGGYSLLSAVHILARQKENKLKKRKYFNEKNLKIVTFGAPLVLEQGIEKNTDIGKLLGKVTTNFINQFDLVPRIGEGIELEYLKKLTEKSIDDSMKKVWGLKQVDAMFGLNIQDKVQSALFERDDIKNVEKVQKEIYGAIGKYYMLMDRDKPAEVISYGKKRNVYVRQLKGRCLYMPDPKKLLALLPRRSGLFAHHMLYDHLMNNYLRALYFMDK